MQCDGLVLTLKLAWQRRELPEKLIVRAQLWRPKAAGLAHAGFIEGAPQMLKPTLSRHGGRPKIRSFSGL